MNSRLFCCFVKGGLEMFWGGKVVFYRVWGWEVVKLEDIIVVFFSLSGY